ncbi:PDZ domain-containing protein [Orenia marismortui]|uniref:PDZ domain-containing protein n=1 Tax=Orenia marismortui TaxID=46469 RepID=UPI000373A8C1|nr:PDZ domain-containing protein [Orenia marismortui]
MPHLTGWDDLDKTIAYLDRYGAETIRVFLPGYTKYSPESIKFNLSLWNDLRVFIDKCRTKYEVPITLEPSRIVNLDAIISGIIKDSPAAKSKLEIGDKIIKVNDKELFSRVDAFNQILKAANPKLSLERTGRVE